MPRDLPEPEDEMREICRAREASNLEVAERSDRAGFSVSQHCRWRSTSWSRCVLNCQRCCDELEKRALESGGVRLGVLEILDFKVQAKGSHGALVADVEGEDGCRDSPPGERGASAVRAWSPH